MNDKENTSSTYGDLPEDPNIIKKQEDEQVTPLMKKLATEIEKSLTDKKKT
jgi:hypothetical protein